ncbi:MAG TPA: hypothetical protein VMT66_03660 [Steroidobacteraceae bacterium]|nr:hypothetical protein [Steroidobacteraceae bacterium]
MVEGRKRAISIRLSVADVRRIKKLAQRLNVRDSDVIRFAIKAMLSRLMPFYEPEARGRNLVPVLVEAGVEFLRFFDLDTARLDAIINGEVEADKRVSREDLALITLAGIQEPYAALKLNELNDGDSRSLHSSDVATSIRQYLYQKYVYRSNSESDMPAPLRLAVSGGTT